VTHNYSLLDSIDKTNASCGNNHGKLERENMKQLRCPACHKMIFNYQLSGKLIIYYKCPRCGAEINITLHGEEASKKA
jgi:phage FluMu protein Com